jgi:hypothetical protein
MTQAREDADGQPGHRARRRAARKTVEAYYETRLRELVDRVRAGLAATDDVFDAERTLAQYARAHRDLSTYCWGRGTGGHVEHVAVDLELDPTEQHPIDWWEAAATPAARR